MSLYISNSCPPILMKLCMCLRLIPRKDYVKFQKIPFTKKNFLLIYHFFPLVSGCPNKSLCPNMSHCLIFFFFFNTRPPEAATECEWSKYTVTLNWQVLREINLHFTKLLLTQSIPRKISLIMWKQNNSVTCMLWVFASFGSLLFVYLDQRIEFMKNHVYVPIYSSLITLLVNILVEVALVKCTYLNIEINFTKYFLVKFINPNFGSHGCTASAVHILKLERYRED